MSAAGERAGAREVEVRAEDLPLHCPRPDAPLWALHPRVFLDVVKHGVAMCPYCGTKYVYKGEPPKRGH
ncbi:MAG: zinc-finger domain-containing protein [Burkholderiales bacterium]|nr:zinc-finger domain-containing protein [Burkholderiales bacterium]MDW8469223.1 zinc-finger domain-containing protein [Burkholderiales bacterium]